MTINPNIVTEITPNKEPWFFENIGEIIGDSTEIDRSHRKGATFYTKNLIEFTPEIAQYYPEVKDFEKYIGFWVVNATYTDGWGYDTDHITLAKRVKPITKSIIQQDWIDWTTYAAEEADTIINKKELQNLKEDSEMLSALVEAGVDNWSGYPDALKLLDDI